MHAHRRTDKGVYEFEVRMVYSWGGGGVFFLRTATFMCSFCKEGRTHGSVLPKLAEVNLTPLLELAAQPLFQHIAPV